MAIALFDTLEYVKLLKQVNFTQQQAECLSEAQNMVAQSVLSQTATQNDLINTRTALKEDIRVEVNELRKEMHQMCGELRAEMHQMCGELRAEMHQIRDELRKDMHQLSYNIIIANITIGALIVGILGFIK